MKNCINWRVWSMICVAFVTMGVLNQTTKNALKVSHVLKQIERQSSQSAGKSLSAEVSEAELNDYLGYRLTQEKATPVQSIVVDLLSRNQVQGKIKIDARQLNLGTLFSNDLHIDFKGILQSRNNAAKLDLSALQLNGRPVNQQFMNLVLSAVGKYYGTEMSRIDDWYLLPKGVKQVTIKKGIAVLYY